MIVIGITGTIGAGKGTIVDYLKTKGFIHYSARDFFLQEIKKRGLEATRENMTNISAELKKNHFPGFVISELLKEAKDAGVSAVIESVRNVGEIEILRKSREQFYLFAVDADEKIRYERIKARKLSTDNISFEKFVEDEKRETETTEPWQNNLRACIKEADVVFENNGTVEELYKKIDHELGTILGK